MCSGGAAVKSTTTTIWLTLSPSSDNGRRRVWWLCTVPVALTNSKMLALGARAVVVASGGLSHYPGTARYIDPGPDTEFDRKFMDLMAAGDVRYLLALDEPRLDETGNIELRCWGMTAGMMGGRKPDMTDFEPTWHHNYGTIAWTGEADEQPYAPHYPPVRADRVVLTETLHRLVTETDHRDRYIADWPH